MKSTSNPLTYSILLFLSLAASLNRISALKSSDISLVDFQGLVYSEVNGEIEVLQALQALQAQEESSSSDVAPRSHDRHIDGRYLRKEDVLPQAQNTWDRIVMHGWKMSSSSSSNKTNKSGNTDRKLRNLAELDTEAAQESQTPVFPFIVCSHSSVETSAYQRLAPLLERTGAHLGDAGIIRNDPNKTCFHVSMEHEAAQEIRQSFSEGENNKNDHYYTILPLVDLMKIQVSTLSGIFEDNWVVPETSSPSDWERLIRVGLSSGHRMNLSKAEVSTVANNIIASIQSAAVAGASNRGRRLHQDKEARPSDVSLSDLFSLTREEDEHKARHLRSKKKVTQLQGRQAEWKRSLELGLEAEHSCQVMFDTMHIDVHYNNKGFDIVLNPSSDQDNSTDGMEEEEQNIVNNDGIEYSQHDGIEKQEVRYEKGIESSASNKHCVASLIMALSTHPSILSIETEGPAESNDFESQWITQSKTVGKRPLRGSGITGENQIITVIDSGLDINNKYFGPTNNAVYNRWDYSNRKVVRYDHSIGDKHEPRGGHGTKCAGAAAGKVAGRDNEANGVAENAKLHIIDIQRENGGLRMPNAFSVFESMHSTSGTPSRIASGSWATAYRAYPYSCKFFDEALHDSYQGDLYVASTGNDGYDNRNLVSKMRSVGNPASCKNTLAVGASQSDGDRLASGAKGMDYIAAFSSRGPTYDGRMKPDLVAPGASVLAPYAHEYGKTVQVYGTSFAAPTVAGDAALVRQYFTEGKLPCTWTQGCKIDPSGSLVKAVLMNSATPLQGVQVVRPGLQKKLLKDTVSQYDSNQGMGLIQLDTTLPLPGKNRIKAIVKNNKQIVDEEVQDVYIEATPGKCANTLYKLDLRVTLAWYDPAGASSCAKCLINDLDLSIHRVFDNGKVKTSPMAYPNGLNTKDNRNNVERVRIKMGDKRRYRIRVKAANLATQTTKYSLIGSGCFKVIPDPTKK